MEAKRCDCCGEYYDEHMQTGILFGKRNTGLTSRAGLPIMASASFHPHVMINDRDSPIDLCPKCKGALVANTCRELCPGPGRTQEAKTPRRRKGVATEGESPQ